MTNKNIRLVGVYNANGGVQGELAYVFGKLRGTAHCALCDISQGNWVAPKQSWNAMLCKLHYPLEAVHLNEMDAQTALLVNKKNAPAIVYLDDSNNSNNHILLDAQTLETCKKDPQKLLAKINEVLDTV